jgi:hypothetical protein
MIEYAVLAAALGASLWYLWRHYVRGRFRDADGEPVEGDAQRRGPGCSGCDGC